MSGPPKKPNLDNVADIRIARIKKLARAFFNDLDAPVPDDEVVQMAFSFMETLRDSGQTPTPHVKTLVEKHTDLMNLLDTLRREKIVRQNRA
jgi:hypothetical protein